MPKVVVTRPIHEAGLKMLREREGLEVVVHDDSIMSEEELKGFIAGADAAVTLLTDKVTEAVMDAAGPQLKVISQYAVGFDNIDIEAAKRRSLPVTNTPGSYSAQAVVEHAMNMMFALSRHTVPADAFMRSGKYQQWDPNLFLGQQLSGRTVGIVGTGQIGSVFAKACHDGLGMKVLYSDVLANERLESDTGATKVELGQLLAEADVVSVHVPLLPTTHHLIGRDQLHMMKPTAILINTSRGPVVDENALVQALKENSIYGAGLDVFEFEPKLAEGLAELENVVVSPHIGSATETTRIAMAECVARNVLSVLDGKGPESLCYK